MFGKANAFITLHTYSQMWIHPYSHQRYVFPNDINDLEEVGRRAVKALENVYGTKFRFGTGADILYPSSGGSDDWAKSKAGVKFVYLLELRPGENDFDGFLLDRRQLIPTGRETWAGVRVVVDAIIRSQNFDGFLLDRRQLIPTGRETWAGVRVVVDAIIRSQRAVAPGIIINSNTTESSKALSILSPRYSSNNATAVPLLKSPVVPIISQQAVLSRIDRNYRLENLEQKEQIIRRKFQQFRNKVCTDISPWCAIWIHINPNICLAAMSSMQQQCAFSCRFC
ncbi:Zinc carboxypeptidase family protein [Acanthocheilonema viteae]